MGARAPGPDMEYEPAIQWLYGTQLFGIKLGLENVRRLFSAWDIADPEAAVIHVAGTNGKGSVCALMESILREAGCRTGLFTSPHLVTYRERVRVNGEMIEEAAVARLLNELRALVRDWDPHPTFFELTTALGLKYFRERGVEVVILETGLGGRLDATNAVPPSVSVITPIGMDHEKWLGRALGEIAREKAGIIKRGVPVVSATQTDEVRAVLENVAQERETTLDWVDAPWRESPVNLAGEHQRRNAALAVQALKTAPMEVPDEAIREGLSKVHWRGRFQRLAYPGAKDGKGALVVDGAHNPDAAQALVETWREVFGGDAKAPVIFGAVESKDVAGMVRVLDAIAERYFLVRVGTSRGREPSSLRAVIAECSETEVEEAGSLEEALGKAVAAGAPVLVTGSLFLAGEVLALSEPGDFETSLQ